MRRFCHNPDQFPARSVIFLSLHKSRSSQVALIIVIIIFCCEITAISAASAIAGILLIDKFQGGSDMPPPNLATGPRQHSGSRRACGNAAVLIVLNIKLLLDLMR